MKRTVIAMLREAARKYGSMVYLRGKADSGWVGTSFEKAAEEASTFAAFLAGRGFVRNDSVAILAEGCPRWVLSELGLLLAGCVSVPLSIKLLPEAIPLLVNHSKAKALLITKNTAEKACSASPEFRNKELLFIYLDEDSETPELLSGKFGVPPERIVKFSAALEEGRGKAPALGESLGKLAEGTEEGDVVTISYTSGTTGSPKGIMLTHLNYWTNCHDAVDIFEVPEGFTTLLILPVDHSFAHTVGIFAGLLRGIELSFVDARGGGIATLRNIPINLKETEPCFLLTVPALSGNFMKKIISGIEEKGGFIERLFKAGIKAGIRYNGNGFDKPSLGVRLSAFLPYFLAKALVFGKVKQAVFGGKIEFCVGGGAVLDLKQQEFFAALGLPIYQGYGLTEAAPIISANTPKFHKYGSSGGILPSIELKLVKSDGAEAKRGETGEIVIRGGNVMKGYFENPEATAAALKDGWLFTGDLAYLDKDGFLVVVGREKALLIAEDGEKYSPEEIEEAVGGSTDILSQIVVYNDHRKFTTALVVLEKEVLMRRLAQRGIGTAKRALDFVHDELNRYKTDPQAKKVPPAWAPSTFQIIVEPFSEQNRMVNSTMKIVRYKVVETYAGLIEYVYTKEGSSYMNSRNMAAISELSGLA